MFQWNPARGSVFAVAAKKAAGFRAQYRDGAWSVVLMHRLLKAKPL